MDNFPAIDIDRLCIISQKRKFQNTGSRHLDRILTVHIGHSTGLCSLQYDIDAGHRTQFVGDCTGDLYILSRKDSPNANKEQQEQKLSVFINVVHCILNLK